MERSEIPRQCGELALVRVETTWKQFIEHFPCAQMVGLVDIFWCGGFVGCWGAQFGWFKILKLQEVAKTDLAWFN